MRLLCILLILSLNSRLLAKDWTSITTCGLYKIAGVAKMKDNKMAIIANEKTLSEIVVFIASTDEPILAPFMDRPVEAKIKILKKVEINQIEAKIEEIKSRIPNPINPQDTQIELITEASCIKS